MIDHMEESKMAEKQKTALSDKKMMMRQSKIHLLS